MVPTSTVLGTYYLLACADDTELVAETDEAGNCRASASTVQVGRPDLTISAVSNPSTAVPGVDFQVSDTVENQTAFSAGASRTRYYLSGDALRNTGDRLLSGFRAVPRSWLARSRPDARASPFPTARRSPRTISWPAPMTAGR